MTSSRERGRQAAAWRARLDAPDASEADRAAFDGWRLDPANAAALDRLDAALDRFSGAANDPQILAMRRAAKAGRRPSARVGRRLTWAVAAFGCLALAGLAGLWETGAVRRQTWETAAGQGRVVDLPDGSRIQMDGGSRVDVRYDFGQRRIDLIAGQALFDVRSGLRRPFRVVAGDAVVTAVGTRFDVSAFGDRARIVLVEGVVEVEAEQGARRWVMRPGQQVSTDDQGGGPSAVDVAAALSWTQGRIVFADTPLDEAVAAINRNAERPVRLDAAGVEARPVSGVFDAGDSRGFAEAAAQVLGLSVSETDGEIRLEAQAPTALRK